MGQAETEKLTQMVFGAGLGRAISSIAELGVADQIEAGSPQPIESLARATGAHERSLYRILRFLASHGIFRETGNRSFEHTPLSYCLRSNAEGSFRAAARIGHRISSFWDGLHHSAITGESGFTRVFGQPLFDYLGTHPDVAPIFDGAMAAIHGHETPAMLDAYDFSDHCVLADVGGGNGSLIAATLQRYPKLKGILFDLDHVIRRTRESLQASGIEDRCSLIEGNFFESLPGGAETYLFRHIIHDWSDEQSVQILKNCRKVIPKTGRLLIIEAVVPTGNEPSLAKEFDMVMLVLPGGIERTEEEYRILLEKAGFQLRSVTPTRSAVSIVEGTPVG
jgi:ubiquinone/menaquinone biosynthesis C-methylase UbiE